jgi:hypothetical protein
MEAIYVKTIFVATSIIYEMASVGFLKGMALTSLSFWAGRKTSGISVPFLPFCLFEIWSFIPSR